MAFYASSYWGFSLADGVNVDERVGPNKLTTESFVGNYSPTNVSASSGPPIGKNDLVDYDPEALYEKPYSRKAWLWFLEQVRALAIVGIRWDIPVAVAYGESEIAWLHQATIDHCSEPELYWPVLLDSRLFWGIHNLLNQVNAIKLEQRPVVWCRAWFEQAVEILRQGWAWKFSREWSQAFITYPVLVSGSVSAGNALLGLPVGGGYYEAWSADVTAPEGVSWEGSGSSGAPLYHDYSGQVSLSWRPEHNDPQFPGHVTGYDSDCEAKITGPSGSKTATGTNQNVFVQSGPTIVGLYSSNGSARIRRAHNPITSRDHDSYVYTETAGPA